MDENQILVSIIVPVYNVKEYLSDCIDSLRSQTHEKLEIILVDDGSTDGSGYLCDLAAEEDPRITVLHCPNGGVSAARNRGLRAIHGEYVCFADSDDVCAHYCVEHLLRGCTQNHADLAVGDYESFEENITFSETGIQNTDVCSGRDAAARMIGKTHIKYTIVNFKLYHKRLLRDLRFSEGKIHEDEDFMYQVLYEAEKVVDIHECVYGYRDRPESITTEEYKEARTAALEIAKKRCDFFKEKNEPYLYVNFRWVYAMMLLEHYPRIKKDLKRPDWAKKVKAEFKSIVPELISSPLLSRKRKLTAAVFYFIPGQFGPIMDMREKSINNDRK